MFSTLFIIIIGLHKRTTKFSFWNHKLENNSIVTLYSLISLCSYIKILFNLLIISSKVVFTISSTFLLIHKPSTFTGLWFIVMLHVCPNLFVLPSQIASVFLCLTVTLQIYRILRKPLLHFQGNLFSSIVRCAIHIIIDREVFSVNIVVVPVAMCFFLFVCLFFSTSEFFVLQENLEMALSSNFLYLFNNNRCKAS